MGRTCLAEDGEITLFPASLVDVCLGRHCGDAGICGKGRSQERVVWMMLVHFRPEVHLNAWKQSVADSACQEFGVS